MLSEKNVFIKNINNNLDYNYENLVIGSGDYSGYLQDNQDDSTNLYLYNATYIEAYLIQKKPKVSLSIENYLRDHSALHEVQFDRNATILIKGFSYSDYQIKSYSQNQTIHIVYLDTSIKLLSSDKTISLSRYDNAVRLFPLDVFGGNIINLQVTCYNCLADR